MKCKNMMVVHFISKHEFRMTCDILNHCFNKLAEQVKTKGLCAENYAASVCEASEKRILTTDSLVTVTVMFMSLGNGSGKCTVIIIRLPSSPDLKNPCHCFGF